MKAWFRGLWVGRFLDTNKTIPDSGELPSGFSRGTIQRQRKLSRSATEDRVVVMSTSRSTQRGNTRNSASSKGRRFSS